MRQGESLVYHHPKKRGKNRKRKVSELNERKERRRKTKNKISNQKNNQKNHQNNKQNKQLINKIITWPIIE